MTDNDNNERPFLPPRWFIHVAWKIHRGLYRVSGGRFGLRVPGPARYGMMHVTTIGRRSGNKRGVILAYFDDGPNLITMAMNGWGAPEPAWWLNLQATPEAEVQLAHESRSVVGRAATREERDRLWERWREYDNNLDGYAQRRPAETAVVILEPQPNK